VNGIGTAGAAKQPLLYNYTAFSTKEQREYFIMGIAHAIEPYVRYLGLEVVGVDLNRMKA